MKSATKVIVYASVLIIGIVVLSGCAEVTNIEACKVAKPSGLIKGLIHGFIAPFSFVVSLFIDDVAVYDVNNTGGWYDFGFLVGSGVLFGSGSRSVKRNN